MEVIHPHLDRFPDGTVAIHDKRSVHILQWEESFWGEHATVAFGGYLRIEPKQK
jgi:FAD synthase